MTDIDPFIYRLAVGGEPFAPFDRDPKPGEQFSVYAVPIKAAVHYRLVVEARSGKTHRWPMKRLELAQERALWYLLPENRESYWRGCEVSIEVQHAAPWATVESLEPPEEATDD